MTAHVTRLAPSPTGALHVGKARTFVLNYLLARRNGWRVLMRVEGLIGAISGMWGGKLRQADMNELLDAFDPGAVPREPVVFTAAHDAFLLGR